MNQPDGSPDNWERKVLEKLATSALQEQRRGRYWGIFFKSLTFLYLFLLLFIAAGWFGAREMTSPGKHTALVQVNGVIASGSGASSEQITAGLQAAFKDANTQGIVLRINSPGGSPVQAGQINDEIRRLREQYPNIPLYAVIEDVCASGGYYIAVAADRIFVNRASLVGSIGVLMDGFGFSGVLDKLGVERRLLTAGDNKGFLDPFSPLDPKQRVHAQQMLNDIHAQFIEVVKRGRGDRLKPDPAIFSGLIWTGERSIELGLADALGSVEFVAREVIKAETIVDYTPRENIAERVVRRFGAASAEALWGAATAPRASPVR
ncbi:MAG: S49 family peptidase [Burkholderiales bacterium]|jgi:protease IV|nr:S49 family peptidase [Burkholderiales bacterium]